MRRLIVGLFIALGIVAWTTPPVAAAAEEPGPIQPNIVFVLADDLGWADLACYGSEVHETPNIDRFSRQGVRFTDAYAAAPVCSPTRASLMTGKCPARLHMTIWREAAGDPPRNRRLVPPTAVGDLPHSETTIAERLQAAGYLTAHVGKWHLGGAAHYPQTHGFDVNIGGTLWGAPNTFFYPYRGSEVFRDFRYVPHLEFGQPGEYLTDRLTDEALKVIDCAGSRPFFVYLAYHSVHTPIEAKPEDIAYCSELLARKNSTRNPIYAAMVRSLDANFGRVVEHLRQRGLSDRTIVIFTSDNGGYVGKYQKQQVTDNSPLRSGKGSLYEGGIRVPLIVHWPGRTRAGSVCHQPVLSTDLPSTIATMAGLPGSEATDGDGCDLAPLLKDPGEKLARDILYFHYPHYYSTTTPVSAVRAGEWKLLHYYEDNHLELFNLREDPGEQTNLAATLGGKAEELRGRLRGWLEAVGAQMPAENR